MRVLLHAFDSVGELLFSCFHICQCETPIWLFNVVLSVERVERFGFLYDKILTSKFL